MDRNEKITGNWKKKLFTRILKSMTLIILEQELNITKELDKPFTE